MEKVSTYDLALVIGGFLVGAAFIIMIFNMLDGGRRGGRGHRRHRHYDRGDRRYYDDNNYHYDDEEGSGFLPIVLVVLLGIGGVALAQKIGVFKGQHAGASITQSSKVTEVSTEQASDTLVPTPPPQSKKREVYYTPPVEEPEMEVPVAEPLQDYYIRVCVLTKRDNVSSQCNQLKKAGFTVCTMPKGDDIAVYTGPYQSLEKAQQVNETKALNGIIESYAK